MYGAAAGIGGGLAGMGGMGLLYSTSFLHAGFIGLGALWLASYLGHGGWAGSGGHYPAYSSGGGYGGGYDDYGGNYEGGGYGGYGPPDHYGRGDKKGYRSYDDSDYKRKKRSLVADGGYRRRLQEGRPGVFTFKSPIAVDGFYPENHQDAKNEEEHIIEVIQRSDSDSCSLRLVCELSAIRHRVLNKEEWDILRLVRYGDTMFNAAFPGQGVSSGSNVLAPYKEAGLHGKRGGDCAALYKKCFYSSTQIMNIVRTLKT